MLTDEFLIEVQAAALASISDAVMITDREGVIIWVNDAFTTMSGYGTDEALGVTPRLLKSGEQDEDYYRRMWETILAGRRWRSEVVERHKDGHHYRVAQTVTPIVDADGGVRYLVAVHEDITALRGSQAHLRALFDHALDGMVLYDDAGRVLDVNPAVSEMSGYTREQLIQKPFVDFLAAEDVEVFETAWGGLHETGSIRGTIPLIRADGQRIKVEFQSAANIVPGVHMSVVRDVTEQQRLQASEQFQAQLLDAVGEAVIATDLDGTVTYWNPAAEQMYGWPSSDVLGRNIADLTIAEPTRAQAAEIMQQVQAGQSWTGRYDAHRADGALVPAWVTDAPFYDSEGQLAGIIGVSSDISELEDARTQLAERVRQQTAVAELGRYALHLNDPRAVGAEAERRVNELLEPLFRVRMRWSVLPDSPPGADDGEVFRIPVTSTSMLCVSSHDGKERLGQDDEEFLRAVAHVIAAAARHHGATSDLEHLATHDPLTGLPNRTLFTDRLGLARAAATRSGRGYAVLFLDLDDFKSINDGLGHQAGDEILQMASDRLRGVLRPADTVARFGGDEFAVVCPDLDTSGAGQVARRIRQALAAPLETSHGPLTVTASIGVACGDGSSEPARLLRDVDTAMYAAKANGRNRIEFFDASLHELARQRLSTSTLLREALANDGIVVQYQPTVALATGTLAGVEALVRLRNADGSLLPPAAFIDIAEEAGLIGALGQHVLEVACARGSAWVANDPAFTVAVNLSPRQLTDPQLGDTIVDTLHDTGLPTANLWLEITESALLAGPHVRATIGALRLLGVNFAIDDFGTGYSSLAHLRDTPVDALKIDRAFVAGMLEDPRDRALIVASLDLARAFGLATVAEGVETDLQRRELTRLGCHYGQGYLWSPPVGPDHITRMQAACAKSSAVA